MLAWLQAAHAIAALGGHVGLSAQRKPNLPRRDSRIERLDRGAPEIAEHQVVRQGSSARSELIIDRAKELASSHP